MRRLPVPFAFLLLAACASRPQPVVETVYRPPVVQPTGGGIFGLTAQDLVQRLGPPALQVREGASLKLQFRNQYCVLDAYLYPPNGAAAPYRVSHVDTRNRGLAPVDQATCLSSLQGA